MINYLLNLLPISQSLQHYSRTDFLKDLVAGLTTAFVLIPQSMAYAMLAGLPPHVGLYAAAFPLLPYVLLGTSPSLAVGPIALDSLLTATAVSAIAATGTTQYWQCAIVLALMVGCFQVLLGMFRAGFVANALSQPVIAGFTAAAALIISFNQLKLLLGIPLARSTAIHAIILQAFANWQRIHVITLITGILAIVYLLLLKKYKPKFPRALFLLVGGVCAVAFFDVDQNGLAVIGSVPSGLPKPSLPDIDLELIQALLPSAFVISLVGFVEAFSVAKSLNKPNHPDLRANQELVALGYSNIVSGWFQAFPISGGFSRSAVNSNAGAVSQVAALITAFVVLLTLMFLTQLVALIPTVILGAIIVTAVLGLIDIKQLKKYWHIRRSDFWLYTLTFGVTLAFGIQQGILAGVFFSLLWFIAATSKPHIAVLGWLEKEDIYRNVERFPEAIQTPGVLMIRFDAPLFFANTNYLKNQVKLLESQMKTKLEVVVINAAAIGRIDATGADTLMQMATELKSRKISLYLANVRGPVRDVLFKAGFFEIIPESHMIPELRHWREKYSPIQKHKAL